MSILKSRPFWAALALPAFIYWLSGTDGILSYLLYWSPCSLLLLLAALVARKDKNLNVALIENEQGHETNVHSKNFIFFGRTYSLFEVISNTVQESDDKYVWTITKDGEEKRLHTNGVSFREGHKIRVYELREKYKSGGYSTYEDAVIFNDNTKQYQTKIDKNAFDLPSYVTYAIYTLLCACVISFVIFSFNLSYWPGFLAMAVAFYLLIKWCNKQERVFYSQIESLAVSLRLYRK